MKMLNTQMHQYAYCVPFRDCFGLLPSTRMRRVQFFSDLKDLAKPNLRKRDPCTSTTIPMATRFAPDFGCVVVFNTIHHRKLLLTWQGKIHYLKMYFLLNMWIFHCHGSFRECTLAETNSRSHLKHFQLVQIRVFFSYSLPQTSSNHLARKATSRYTCILIKRVRNIRNMMMGHSSYFQV